ncbi:MAG: DUF5678 domain-containing protein [Candidatus Nanoarchaeia archaeon]|nr:DUF5678 domain-containing protein [Candidatus Nanoarchaeia archaeon]
MDNYQFFLKADVDEYVGEWIAVCEEKIVSHGKDAKKVYEEAKLKCPKKRPLLTRVPDKEAMIF